MIVRFITDASSFLDTGRTNGLCSAEDGSVNATMYLPSHPQHSTD